MNEPKISLTIIAARLERTIQCNVGLQGLNTLLFGWQQKRKRKGFGEIKFFNRKQDSGEAYLFYSELLSFSAYAGYDLTLD